MRSTTSKGSTTTTTTTTSIANDSSSYDDDDGGGGGGGKNRDKVALFLGGSFYPLHEGHIQLLLAAKEYLEIYRHKKVVNGILCPSHPSALQRKFGDGWDVKLHENRTDHSHFLVEKYHPFIVWDDRLLRAKQNIGMRATAKEIETELSQRGIQFIQVVGGDSQVRSVLRNNQQKPGSVILVIDSRGIPPENRDLLEKNNNDNQQQPHYWVVTIPPDKMLPPISSTIDRFLIANNKSSLSTFNKKTDDELFPPSAISKFSLDWLTDTGWTLGAGRQGLVRLMRVGHKPVAVKLYKNGGKKFDSFQVEEPIWSKALKGWNVAPDLIATGTTPDGRFSYLVTEVGTPFEELLPKLDYNYKWKPKDEKPYLPFLQEEVVLYPIPCWPPKKIDDNDVVDKQIDEQKEKETLSLMERIHRAAKLILGMNQCRQKLEQSGVLHRDLKVSNFLLMSNGEVRLCDYGVAVKAVVKKADDSGSATYRSPPRGSLRQYPLVAIDSFYYDFGCDEYFLSNSIAEVINERPIYDGDSVEEVIMKRRQGIHPSWDEAYIEQLQALSLSSEESQEETKNTDADYLLQQIASCEAIWARYDNGACPNRRTPKTTFDNPPSRSENHQVYDADASHDDDDISYSSSSNDTAEMIHEYLAARNATDTKPESNEDKQQPKDNRRGNKKNKKKKKNTHPNSLDSLRQRVSELMTVFEENGYFIPLPESASSNSKVWSSRIYGADKKRQRKNAERQAIIDRIHQLEHCLKDEHGIEIASIDE